MMSGTRTSSRTLTECVGIHFLDIRSLSHGKQPAGFFPLASKPLFQEEEEEEEGERENVKDDG